MRGARWDYGEAVRLTRNVRNDGTYPGLATGAPLLSRGSVGYVVDIGTFLQDQIIYAVNFLDDARTVGCREEELIGAEEPWTPSRFEFRERVCTARSLAIGGVVLVAAGTIGEVVKVVGDASGGTAYQLHFDVLPGRVLQIPEDALRPAELSPAGKDQR